MNYITAYLAITLLATLFVAVQKGAVMCAKFYRVGPANTQPSSINNLCNV